MPKLTLTVEEVMAEIPTIGDARAARLVGSALETARRVAPCVDDDSFDSPHTAKDILLAAIRRRVDFGSGIISQSTVVTGIYSQSASAQAPASRTLLWPSEVRELQDMCRRSTVNKGKAWSFFMGGMPS